MSSSFLKYGRRWAAKTDPLQIEFSMIQNGGDLYTHYKAAMELMWPEDDWHPWNELCLHKILEETYLGIMGPASSGKTDIGAKYALADYFCYFTNTCTLVSSTEGRGLELRVWGRIKQLFNRAKDNFPWLPGNVLESMRTITTDRISDNPERARVLNRGIICIPCMSSGRWIGIGKYQGIKNKRVRLIADEASIMQESFLDSIANLRNNPDFKAVFLGNPLDPMDPLGRACEPLGGWSTVPDTGKTEFWRTRFMGGAAICLNGLDSPNNDFPGDKPRYPYLIHRKGIEEISAFWGKDSHQYYSQAIGVMKLGLEGKRVITMQICREHKAFTQAFWAGTGKTKVYACDAAYSGTNGDRCVGGSAEFGEGNEGYHILKINPPKIIPVSVKTTESPEDQIAKYIQADIEEEHIPIQNVFYDSTGRGTLGIAFARIFGSSTPVPVEFGGRPSKRPVRHDLFVIDPHTRVRRHVRCDEHFYDFVSELWMMTRYVIEWEQIRELPEDVALEGCSREYGRTAGNKFFVESKHNREARKRMARSPDLYDWFVTILEGARQRGFKIQRLGAVLVEDDSFKWLSDISEKNFRLAKSKMLVSK